jgi:hypothetical protein
MGFFRGASKLLGKVAPIAGGIGGAFLGGPMGAMAGASLGSMFGGGNKNPAEAARPYMERTPAYGREAHNPFIQQGNEAWGALRPEYEKALTHPQELYNEDVAGYEPSQHYQKMAPYLMQAMENTAGAGGFMGNEHDQRQRAEMVQALMSGDMGDYLNRVESRRNLGMQGFETATGRGHQSAGSLADFFGTADMNRGNMEMMGKTQQGINKNAFTSALMQAIASGFGAYGGAGAMRGQQEQQMPSKTGADLRTIGTNIPPFGGSIYNRYGGGR